MQLSNNKLVNRAVNMVVEATGVDITTAQALLREFGNVRKAVENAAAFKDNLDD
jgi:N-acetylmuramic acid 6-phosphate etherase